jgi:HSP20 family protein
VADGQLTIKAERSEKKESKRRSEFSYGSFVRSVTLPAGADEDDITASYDKGILTVSVALPKAPPAEKHITVKATTYMAGRPRCGRVLRGRPTPARG